MIKSTFLKKQHTCHQPFHRFLHMFQCKVANVAIDIAFTCVNCAKLGH